MSPNREAAVGERPAVRPAQIQSVERAARLLQAVASASGAASTASALAQTVGLNRTTTWRILSTLERQGLVSVDRQTGRYCLGFGLLGLTSGPGGANLLQATQRILRRLAQQSGETAALATMRDDRLTYITEASAGSVVAAAWEGRSVALHATSTGKAYLAFVDGDELSALLGPGRLTRFTDTTITSRSALQRELERTRARRYGVCRGEFESSAWGVSAPVLDDSGRPVAVISVWGPAGRLTEDRFDDLGRLALASAEELAGR
ncbi:IclR family transcriptional regulator [Naumannella halotolerans]|uniref:Glycerol operon regulatory protein n=1 Tax=Naumannella halotolerans TaxID=993414 RepID=A0A4R7J1X9_9ACTN|nr:IclR family transcriptional regulator [Naumannella halotolerans]TDT31171.1 DNA-binding IclR family transcriptional regulator [Naumannella halotolerans]